MGTSATATPVRVEGIDPAVSIAAGQGHTCAVTVDNEVKFACVDGPFFDAHQVDFQEAVRRSGKTLTRWQLAYNEADAITDRRLLWQSLLVLSLAITCFVLAHDIGQEPATLAMFGAAPLLESRPIEDSLATAPPATPREGDDDAEPRQQRAEEADRSPTDRGRGPARGKE